VTVVPVLTLHEARVAAALHVPETAYDRSCELVSYHAPAPVVTEHHHRRPIYLQLHLWGAVRYPADLWVCSNCHEAIHAWAYWLLGERKQPPRIGRAAKAEAESMVAWYEGELAA
jgi:hypothetical protein